jgi:hypothetical protein
LEDSPRRRPFNTGGPMQMRRLIVPVVVAASALVLAAPAPAWSHWTIADGSGKQLGEVRQQERYKAYVFDQITMVGEVAVDGLGITWFAFIPNADGISLGYGLTKVSPSRWRVQDDRGRPGMMAVRTSRRWMIKKRRPGHWKRVATAPRNCPGQFALGGARVLLAVPPRGPDD